MYKPLIMRLGKSPCDTLNLTKEDQQVLARRQGVLFQMLGQGVAIHETHGDVRHMVMFPCSKHLADCLMPNTSGQHHLTFKTPTGFRLKLTPWT